MNLVERLRRYSFQPGNARRLDEQGELIFELVTDMHKAADEIERLRAAADDYKALEDMREKFMPEQIEVAFSHIGFGHRWAYEVGDYQKTLAVLERGEVTKCDDCVEALRDDEG